MTDLSNSDSVILFRAVAAAIGELVSVNSVDDAIWVGLPIANSSEVAVKVMVSGNRFIVSDGGRAFDTLDREAPGFDWAPLADRISGELGIDFDPSGYEIHALARESDLSDVISRVGLASWLLARDVRVQTRHPK